MTNGETGFLQIVAENFCLVGLKQKGSPERLPFALRASVDYCALTSTLPPPSGSSEVLVPTRRQITPLLSRIVMA